MIDSLNNINLTPIAIVFGVVLFLYLKRGGKYKYEKHKALFSAAEINFKNALSQAIVNPNLVVYGKVRIADIITPSINKKFNNKMWWKAFTKISSKHVDYVICDKRNYSVLCVLELDDQSHNTSKAKQRDSFVNKAYKSAGIELIRVKASSNYPQDVLLNLFSKKVQQQLRGNR